METGKVESVVGWSPAEAAEREAAALQAEKEAEAAEGDGDSTAGGISPDAKKKGATSMLTPRSAAATARKEEKKAEKRERSAKDLARQALFYADQNEMRDKMHLVAARCAKMNKEDWFVFAALPGIEGEAPACVRANVHTVNANKNDPENFDYETPLKLTRMMVGQVRDLSA